MGVAPTTRAEARARKKELKSTMTREEKRAAADDRRERRLKQREGMMAGDAAHHEANSAPLAEFNQRNAQTLTATQAHQQATARRTAANQQQNQLLLRVDDWPTTWAR